MALTKTIAPTMDVVYDSNNNPIGVQVTFCITFSDSVAGYSGSLTRGPFSIDLASHPALVTSLANIAATFFPAQN